MRKGLNASNLVRIKGKDIQRGTFYHLEAAVEKVQVSLWMLWRAGQGQKAIITLTPRSAGSQALQRTASTGTAILHRTTKPIGAKGNVTAHLSINSSAKDL